MNGNFLRGNHADKDEVKSRVNITDVVRSYGVDLERKGKELLGLCPFHNDVKHPNLYVNEQKHAFHCKACGAGGDVIRFVMLMENCEFPEAVDRLARQYGIGIGLGGVAATSGRAKHNGEVGGSMDSNNTATLQHSTTRTDNAESPAEDDPSFTSCTLQQYAEDKGLSIDSLRQLGLSDINYMGKPAIRMPYRGPDGSELAVRIRTALRKSKGTDNRFKWRKGAKPKLYGLDHLDQARKVGYVTLVEGESDCQTLWLHNEPALGVPGANTWRDEWAEEFQDIPTIYLVVEGDQGGETLKEKIKRSPIKERIRFVRLGEAKDPSGLYLQDREGFKAAWSTALESAVPAIEEERTEAEVKSKKAWQLCSDLAHEPDILARFAEAIKSRVAGEVRAVMLLYLVLTSRLLAKPVSAAVKGPSSAGKSRVVEQTAAFFPGGAYYALTGMSEKALAYSNEPLAHRILVIYEATGMEGEFASYLIRSLLSEGRLRYETVEKTAHGLRARMVERDGPTGLIVTTTAIHLHPENETRMLSITITDTPEQTRAVLQALASESEGATEVLGPYSLEQWRALQEWLEISEHQVTIPFAKALVDLVPPVSVRLRRDVGALLNLIRVHALLHQASRQKDAQGRIIAKLEDYGVVRELIYEIVAEGIEATVSQNIKDTVEAVRRLTAGNNDGASTTQVAHELKLDKSSASRRITACIEHGYIRNLETQKGRPSKLVVGDDLPSDRVILPTIETLAAALGDCCSVAPLQGEIDSPSPDLAADLSSSDADHTAVVPRQLDEMSIADEPNLETSEEGMQEWRF